MLPARSLFALNLVLPLAALAQMPGPTALGTPWNQFAVGQAFDQAEAESVWGKPLRWWRRGVDTRIVEVATPTGPEKRLRVPFAPDLWGEKNFLANINLDPRDDYTLAYTLRFGEGFEFNRGNRSEAGPQTYGGGKLPGMSAGKGPAGGNHLEGMSARLMWRSDDRFTPGRVHPYLELYLYWAGMESTYGDRLYLQPLEAGRDYAIKLRVNVGEGDRPGFVRIWVDGEPRLDRSYPFRRADERWQINQIMFHTFYGGNDLSWAPLKPTHIDFGALRIDTKPF